MRVRRVFIQLMRFASQAAARGGQGRRSLPMLTCALALAAPACAVAAGTGAVATEQAPAAVHVPANGLGPSAGSSSATVEQCVTSSVQAERSATFIGEMTAMPGPGRMSMRFELQQRLAGEPAFRRISAPGLGVWRAATGGVKVYRYIKQVTDLAAPALYRAAIHFRWVNSRGKLIRGVERHTTACVQTVPVPATTTTPASG